MPSKQFWVCFVVVAALAFGGSRSARAQRVDLLKAEGSPTDVAQKVEKEFRALLKKASGVNLLANPLSPVMARMTLGCASDSPSCMKRLAQMRNAQYIYTLRVLPAGGPMVLTMLRKIDGKTGKTVKAASHTFMKNQVNSAAAALAQKIGLGASGKAAPRVTPPARRVAAPVRRPAPRPALRVVPRTQPPPPVVAVRPAPVVRRVPAPRAVPVRRPAPRFTFKPVKLAARPKARPVVRRVTPPKPRVRIARPTPRRVAPPKPRVRVAQPTPRRVAPPKPRVRVATATPSPKVTRRVPPPSNKTSLLKRPILWAWVAVGVTAVASGVAISFGALASARQNEINQKLKDSQTSQALSYKTDIQPLENEGRSNALISNVSTGFAVAGAAAAAALFVLSFNRPKKPKAQSALPASNTKRAKSVFFLSE